MWIQLRRGDHRIGYVDRTVLKDSNNGGMYVLLSGDRHSVLRDAIGYYVELPPLPVQQSQATYSDNLVALKTQAQVNADGLPIGATKTAWLGVVATLTTAIGQVP